MKDTPKQIEGVVNVDRMDSIDRAKLDTVIKLQLLMAEAKIKFGRDPRSGGMSIVARPRVILQMMMDMKVGPFHEHIRLHRAIVMGEDGGDLVGHWQDVPIIVRCTVTDDMLHVEPNKRIPPSKFVDRRQAGRIRVATHNANLEALRDQE